MPFLYNLPDKVLSPKKNISNVKVIHDGGNNPGGYSVAIVKWNNTDSIAIRWNISENEWIVPDKISGKKRA